MKKLTLLILVLNISIAFAQNKVYRFEYKQKIEGGTDETCETGQAFIDVMNEAMLKKMVCIYYSDKDFNYADSWDDIESTNPFIKIEIQNGSNKHEEYPRTSEMVYIDYNKNIKFLELDEKKAYTNKPFVFLKDKEYSGVINGYKVSKYVSSDGIIEVFTSKELPWNIQPTIFLRNYFKEGIVKINTSEIGLSWIIEDVKEVENTEDFENKKQQLLRQSKIAKVETLKSLLYKDENDPKPVFEKL
ncbi:hypothetical protein [Aureivirga sp. CE67]|uniref:hypothetical protein n=1 Tax=Aureivirga sp. CE67 TaxID=1788983 RepID=UPI0018CA79B2|nr:hypothetical protein [Aureivirga sp. CE67]